MLAVSKCFWTDSVRLQGYKSLNDLEQALISLEMYIFPPVLELRSFVRSSRGTFSHIDPCDIKEYFTSGNKLNFSCTNVIKLIKFCE